MITKKVILSLLVLAALSAAATAQSPAEETTPAPSYETYQWKMICSSSPLFTGQIVGIAASHDEEGYLTVASDGSGSNYSSYLLRGNDLALDQHNVPQQWMKVGAFSNFKFGSICYDQTDDQGGNAFKILGRDLNGQPKIMLFSDNGLNWQEAKFISIGSDHDVYSYRFINKYGNLQVCDIPASACDYQESISNPYHFAAVGYQQDYSGDKFIAIDSNGSTYVTVGSDASE